MHLVGSVTKVTQYFFRIILQAGELIHSQSQSSPGPEQTPVRSLYNNLSNDSLLYKILNLS